MDLKRFCFRFLLKKASALVLSTCIFVGGCGCPISIRVVRSGTASYAFINDAWIYTSAPYDIAFVIIFHTLWMVPFSKGSSQSSLI